MYENISLSELIKELQSIEKEYGNREVLSIGSCCGQFKNLRNPFSIRFSKKDNEESNAYIATRKEDIGKSFVRN